MNHDQLILAAAAALFAAFLIGWVAGWLMLRTAKAPAQPPVTAPPAPVDEGKLAAVQAEASANKAALDEALIEIEELRGYIERRLSQRPAPDA